MLRPQRPRLEYGVEASRTGAAGPRGSSERLEKPITTDCAQWSEETFRLFGMDAGTQENHRRTFLDRVHPNDRARVDQALSDAINGTQDYNLEYRIALPDRTEKIIHAVAEVFRDAAPDR